MKMVFVVNRNTKEVLVVCSGSNSESHWGVYNDDYDAISMEAESVDSVTTSKYGKRYLNFEDSA